MKSSIISLSALALLVSFTTAASIPVAAGAGVPAVEGAPPPPFITWWKTKRAGGPADAPPPPFITWWKTKRADAPADAPPPPPFITWWKTKRVASDEKTSEYEPPVLERSDEKTFEYEPPVLERSDETLQHGADYKPVVWDAQNNTVIDIAPSTDASWWKRGEEVCDPVSNRSPSRADVKRIIDILQTAAPQKRCVQTNGGGSFCKSIEHHKSASVSLCGTFLYSVTCRDLAWAAQQVLDICSVGDKVAGSWRFDDHLRAPVHHS